MHDVATMLRYGAVKHFTGRDGKARAFSVGAWVAGALFGNTKARDWCIARGIAFDREVGGVARAASVGVGTAGGFLVPHEVMAEILVVRERYGVLRKLCRVAPMASDVQNWPKETTGFTAEVVAEGAAITAVTAAFGSVGLVARKWGVLSSISSELAEDAVLDIAEWFIESVGRAFAQAEDTAGFNGDGSATYHGIAGICAKLTAGSMAGAVLATSGHDTAAEIDATDIGLAVSALPARAWPNARWFLHPAMYANALCRLAANTGGLAATTNPDGTITANYLGRPVEFVPSMATGSADVSGQIMLAFGDVRQAVTFGERRGVTVARSENGSTSRPTNCSYGQPNASTSWRTTSATAARPARSSA
jgi:HK97 family phage major capsid protein